MRQTSPLHLQSPCAALLEQRLFRGNYKLLAILVHIPARIKDVLRLPCNDVFIVFLKSFFHLFHMSAPDYACRESIAAD